MSAKENQKIIMTDELVGQIHDRLLDENNLDLANAFNESCVELAFLYRHIENLEKIVSFGFIRLKNQ